jgi:hypothetical protein
MSREDKVRQAAEQYYTALTEAQHPEVSHLPGATISEHEIDALMNTFFSAVSFVEGDQPAYHRLGQLFVESGRLIKAGSTAPEISTVSQFIEPRQHMVDSGELTCFQEVEMAEITERFGNVAHRLLKFRQK